MFRLNLPFSYPSAVNDNPIFSTVYFTCHWSIYFSLQVLLAKQKYFSYLFLFNKSLQNVMVQSKNILSHSFVFWQGLAEMFLLGDSHVFSDKSFMWWAIWILDNLIHRSHYTTFNTLYSLLENHRKNPDLWVQKSCEYWGICFTQVGEQICED